MALKCHLSQKLHFVQLLPSDKTMKYINKAELKVSIRLKCILSIRLNMYCVTTISYFCDFCSLSGIRHFHWCRPLRCCCTLIFFICPRIILWTAWPCLLTGRRRSASSCFALQYCFLSIAFVPKSKYFELLLCIKQSWKIAEIRQSFTFEETEKSFSSSSI